MQAKQKQEGVSLKKLVDFDPDYKTVSLPLQFQFLPVQHLSKQFTRLNNPHPYRIHYLGPRPHSTLALHKKYAYSEKTPLQPVHALQNLSPERYRVDSRRIVESHVLQEKLRGNSYYRSGLFYRAFEGMNPYLSQGEWIYNSLFESGNLDCAIKVGENEFDLFLRVDSNTKGHAQWFYFSVKNGSRTNKLKMNLCNLSKAKSLFDAGLQPYVFSKERNKKKGTGWQQAGTNLGITMKQLRYQFLYDKLSVRQMNYYCLQMQYEFQWPQDEVFFAYCIPYTFSRLLKQLQQLPPQWVQQSVLGKSLSGIDIPLLHITNHQLDRQKKKNILITGRWHPGEPNSSHMLQGFIDFLTSPAREAAQLRNRANFFIVPMANPDGVVCGNTRTSLAGKDLNRQFLIANRQFYPQVALVKDLARKLQSSYGLFMYLDFHGHSKKKNTFFYGPAYSIHQPNYYKSRILPKLVEKVDSNFRYHSCSFAIDEEKKHTARAVMFEQLHVAFAFTIQTSIGYYYDCENMKTVKFNEDQWHTIGTSIAQGLSKFLVGFQQYEQILKERRASRHRRRPPTAKNTITQNPPEQEEINSYFKRGEPLKIVYQDKSLFSSLIDQLKCPKINNFIKQIDEDCDSDAHDQGQQFEASKMKEFNSLLSDAAKRNPLNDKKERDRYNSGIKSHRQSQRTSLQQQMQEQILYLSQLEQIKRAPTVNPIKQTTVKQPIQRIPKTSNQSKRSSVHHRQLPLSQPVQPSRTMQIRQVERRINHQPSLQKKMVSQGELANQKISYFGQFKLFMDREEPERLRPHLRNSIFSRERNAKGPRKSVQIQSRFMSESYLQTANRTTITPHVPQSRPVNYQFKFDEIESAVIAKEKLKEYLRTKISRSTRSNVIGPASFYGIRQNINQKKISNKHRFVQNQSHHKDSYKVITFT